MHFTKSYFATVKRVSRDLQYCQEPTEFQYNNIKSKEEIQQLHETLKKAHEEFRVICDIKRMHRQFSKKEMAR